MPTLGGADTPPAVEADPDTQAEVDSMILDYLVCLAIHQILSQRDGHQPDNNEVDWLVDSVQSFRATRHKHQPDTHPPDDLETKLRLFTVADQLRRYTRAALEGRPSLASLAAIGTEFMGLCSAAAAKVSEYRWFDVGARFMAQAALEELHTADQSSAQALQRLHAWTPDKPDQKVKWENSRQKYSSERTLPLGRSAPEHRDARAAKLPVKDFEHLVMDFLGDLMTTLDPPILIQLERGKLGSLSLAETQQLKERAGLR